MEYLALQKFFVPELDQNFLLSYRPHVGGLHPVKSVWEWWLWCPEAMRSC